MTGLEHLWAAAVAIAAMLALSAAASILLPSGARVPMQWGLTGKPTWTAPTWIAVLFTPLVAVIVLGLTLLAAGTDRVTYVTLPSLAMLFLAVHAGHLFFAIRHFSPKRN